MSHGRIILCVALLAAGALCAFISTLIGSEMQGEVNKQLPHDKQLEGPWWFGKQVRLLREHRRLFPNSKLRMAQNSAGVSMFVCLLALAFAIGIL
jgi:hypothetical protein